MTSLRREPIMSYTPIEAGVTTFPFEATFTILLCDLDIALWLSG